MMCKTGINVLLKCLGLLGVVAWLTPVLFDSSVSEKVSPKTPRREQPAPPSASSPALVTDVTITLPPVPPPEPSVRPPAPPSPLAPARPETGPATTPPPAAAKPGVGTVLTVNGPASATDQAMRRRSLSANDRVFENETLETAAGARLQIKLDDGSDLALGQSSSIILDACLLDRQKAENSNFAMRVIRGLCRVVTGAITEVNPDRFKVQTRMCTIGIRGCDVSVRAGADKEEILIITLAPQKNVRVQAASDGTALRNIVTGKEIAVEATRRTTFDVTEPQTMVSLAVGKAPESKPIPGEKLREIMRETSALPATRYDVLQKPDGATLMLQPEPTPSPAKAPQPK